MKKIISWINAAVLMSIAMYFTGSLLAWNFDPTTWWVYTSFIGRLLLGLIIVFLGYSLNSSSNDPRISEKVQAAPVIGHVLVFAMEIMFILIAQHVILTYFIK